MPYEIKLVLNKYTEYHYKTKNDIDQTLDLSIFAIEPVDLKKEYLISFRVYTKGKYKSEDGEITGKDGIKSLLWAK